MDKLLKWDETRYFEAGVQMGVLYPKGNSGYTPGVVWNGLTSVSESPEGADANDIYADNIKYASMRSAETFKATLEAYTYPQEFEECDGSARPATGLVLGQQSRKTFGLCYRTEIGDQDHTDFSAGYKLHLLYGLTAAPSERSYETINDSPDAITFSWEIDSIPQTVADVAGKSYKPVSCLTIDSRDAVEAKLEALEQILYGTPADPDDPQSVEVPARLPLPDEIITLFNAVG